MSFTLRPYKPSDADVITSWLKSEYLMRQWCADRYERYHSVLRPDTESYECLGETWNCIEMELLP